MFYLAGEIGRLKALSDIVFTRGFCLYSARPPQPANYFFSLLETSNQFFQIYEVLSSFTATSSQNINKNKNNDAQNNNVGLVIAKFTENSLKNTLKAPRIQHTDVFGVLMAEKVQLWFLSLIGAFCEVFALFWSTVGVNYLASVVAKIKKWMRHPFFKQTYLEKGQMSTQVEKIPNYIVTDEIPGLSGDAKQFQKGWFN